MSRKNKKRAWGGRFNFPLLTFMAIFAAAAASVAWYANASEVGGSGITVQTQHGEGFELRSYGTKGIYDEDLLTRFFHTITLGKDTDDITRYTTATDNSSINWLMSDTSNIGNYSEDEVDFESKNSNGTYTERKNYAIEPGSSGELTFYIVPNTSGTQTFKLSFNMVPYKATVDETTNKITSSVEVGVEGDDTMNIYARQFITGHIMFLLKEGEGDTAKYTWLKDDAFSVTIENAVAKQEYKYTIAWQWPQVFSQIVLKDTDVYLNGRHPIFTDEIRNQIIKDFIDRPQYYFYNSLTKSPLLKGNTLITGTGELDGIEAIHQKSPKVGGTDGYDAQVFIDLSSFFNQADQIIGNSISYIVLQLQASEGGTE